MEYIKGFIITLITMIVFMTAIEIIAPENTMKKYVKYVLGLILVALLISPIIKFVTGGEKVLSSIVDDYTKEVQTNSNSKYLKKDVVSYSFDKNCEKILENKYQKFEFICNSECDIKYTTMDLYVKKLDIGVKEKGIGKIKQVEICKNDSEDKFLEEVKNYFEDAFDIKKDIINIEYI